VSERAAIRSEGGAPEEASTADAPTQMEDFALYLGMKTIGDIRNSG
jgi:hypothetical protein